MKKLIGLSVLALALAAPVFAAENACSQNTDWTITDPFGVTLICANNNVTCTLVDESGGNPNPHYHNFHEDIDWTFQISSGRQISSSCQAYPMNQNCNFNRPRHTCAYLYVTQNIGKQ